MARILLVEDSPDVASALTEALTQAGHTVRPEWNMRWAMDVLHEGEFDCLIADGHFPSFQWGPPMGLGLDLLRAAKHAKVRGILHSGDEEMVAQAQLEGFPALLKPASVVELLKAVEG